MRQPMTLAAVAAAAALLAACASNPTPPAELVAARDAVHQAESDPNVLKNAPLELQKATEALNRANALNDKGDRLSEIASASYVAQRQAETAMSIARSKANEERMQHAQTERERARADLSTAEAQRAQADAMNARSQATAAQQQATAAQADAVQAQQQAADLQQQLAQLQAKQTDRGMLVTLGDVLFEFGRAEIKPAAQDELSKLAGYLAQHPERRVLIEGYTDSIGSDSANLALSQRRAEAVAGALARLGVAPDRIVTRGYGKSYPIADNATDTNRALNRRVEVYISDNDQPVRGRG